MFYSKIKNFTQILQLKIGIIRGRSIYIREYAARYLENVEIPYQFDFPTEIQALNLSRDVRGNLFLGIKEALYNLTKCAGASLVTLTFSQEKLFLFYYSR